MGSLHYYLQVVFEGISGHDKDAYLAIDNIKFIDCGEYLICSDYQLCTYNQSYLVLMEFYMLYKTFSTELVCGVVSFLRRDQSIT